jgi:hypothetical protein
MIARKRTYIVESETEITWVSVKKEIKKKALMLRKSGWNNGPGNGFPISQPSPLHPPPPHISVRYSTSGHLFSPSDLLRNGSIKKYNNCTYLYIEH